MPKINQPSFWVGFSVGIIFSYLFILLKRHWPLIFATLKEKVQAAKNSITAGTEARLRNDMLRFAQRQHLAASFAALDEILIPPAVLIPPVAITQDNNAISDDDFHQAIPYLPDWPELAANFNSPAISLCEILLGKSNLVLMGQPGSGKTVALAYLASLFARGDSQVKELGNLVPIFIHAGDFDHNPTEKDPLTPIINALATHVTPLTLPRLPSLLRNVFTSGRAIILFDGIDEYPPDAVKKFTSLIRLILERYPLIKMVVVSSPRYYDGLSTLGFLPVAIAAWDETQKSIFLEKWRDLWSHLLLSGNEQPGMVDPKIISGWLSMHETPPNPLEFTLKAWAAFAGDALGPEIPQAIEAYIRRMTDNIPNARPALEKLARQMLFAITPIASQRDAETWLAEFDPEELPSEGTLKSERSPRKITNRTSSNVLASLVSNGLIVNYRGTYLSFNHLMILGYINGTTLAKTGEVWNVQNQPEWGGKILTMQFLACFGNVGNIIENMLGVWDDVLKRDVLTAGRWLRLTPKSISWRNAVMRSLVNIIQKEQTTLGLSARALTALSLTGDANLTSLFRKFFTSTEPNIRLLGILGCGMIHDNKVINELSSMAEDPDLNVRRAACAALMAIGSKPAIDAVALILLQGSDSSRRLAAEALATNVEEGHQILREAAVDDELLVRHAVIFGFAKVRQPWATQLLEKLAIEDGQWVVRNAAAQALEDSKRFDPRIPVTPAPLHDLPWLIKFAGKSGSGITPGKQAIEMLTKALKDGEQNERLAAMEYVRLFGNEDFVIQVYQTYYGSQGVLRETAFNTLWHLAASGVNLPSPAQFGLG